MTDTTKTQITSEDLHLAANIVGLTESPEELGVAEGAIDKFLAESDWNHGTIEMDDLSMVMGISIGLAAQQNRDAER